VFLDGEFAFNLEAEVAVRADLRVGQELDGTQIETLTRQNREHRSMSQALSYLSYRPRSETELREKLRQKGIPSPDIETVISKLKERGLLNDGDFARFWKENRQSFSPRSKRLLQLEMKSKGIPKDIIERVASELNDEEGAYRAALSRAPRLEGTDYQLFHQRLGSYLRRRGFNYEIIKRTVARIWQEWGNGG